MLKKVNNWHLLFLVAIVSIFSVSLAQKYVLAAWQEPGSTPGGVPHRNLVLSPMTASLDLNDNSIAGDNIVIDPDGDKVITINNSKSICFGSSDCRASWPDEPGAAIWNENTNGVDIDYMAGNVGIGINNPDQLLHVNNGNIYLTTSNLWLGQQSTIKATKNDKSETTILSLSLSDKLIVQGNDISFEDLNGNNLVYVEDLGTVANVGIGTTMPNSKLHVYSPPKDPNAEIDIQSGLNTHWGMYQDEGTGDLRFWNDDDYMVIDDATGYIGIGTSTPQSQLHIESLDQNAIYAKATKPGKYGLYAENTAVSGSGIWAQGYYGIFAISNQTNGAGIIALAGTGSKAGYFIGNVESTGNVKGASATVTGNLTAGNATFNGDVQMTTGYFQFPLVTSNPPDADCNSVLDRGKAVFNITSGNLVICNFVKDIPDPWHEYERAVAMELP
jgi:hypothetical protein